MNGFAVYAFFLFGAVTIAPVASSPALLLTPYILKNQTELARNISKVDPKLFLNVTSYSGFLTVNKKYNSNLFFWYFPVENQTVSADTPWIIWLQGGPGSTSLAGLFVEIGPFAYVQDRGLILREWSWNRKYPLLFIDNPAGTGFSFTDSRDGYVTNMDDCSEQLYSALQQFLELFPELRRAPLYLAGESYAGHYLPALGRRILHPPTLSNLKLKNTAVNLKGIMMGNPVIDRRDVVNVTHMYYSWGLIDSQGVAAVTPLQDQYAKAVQENNYEEAREARDNLLTAIENRAYMPQSYNILKDNLEPELKYFTNFVTQSTVREAIHVGSTSFTFTNAIVSNSTKDFLVSLNSEVEELLEHYRIMIYCGQLDLISPCTMNAEGRQERWRWSGRQAFFDALRKPWWHGVGVAGYVKTGGNFTEVLVRGAGHLVPMDKPAEAFQLIDYFIRGLDMPLPSNFDELDVDAPPFLDDDTSESTRSSTSNGGFIASIVLNVVLVTVILAGVFLVIRWKRRTDSYFYSMIDNSSLNGVLTMD